MIHSNLAFGGAVVDAASDPEEIRRLIAGCSNWFFAPSQARYIALRIGELSGIHCANYRALIQEFDCNADPHRQRAHLLEIAHLPFEQNSTALVIEVHSRCSLIPGAAREIARILGAAAIATIGNRMPETMAA